MTFADKLRELLDAEGWTADQLSKKANITLYSVRSYLSKGKAHRLPTLGNAVKLARALGVSLDVFADCVDWDKEDE